MYRASACNISRFRPASMAAERARLARELHDSVAQALYGITLGAKTARATLDRDPSEAGRSRSARGASGG